MPDINLSSPCPPPSVQCSIQSFPFQRNIESSMASHILSSLENKTQNSGVRWVLPSFSSYPSSYTVNAKFFCWLFPFQLFIPLRKSDPTPSLPCLHQLITDLLSLLLPFPSPLVNPVVQIGVTCNTFKAPLRLPIWFDPSIHSIQMSVCLSV
ncbi:hypothetical protein GE21DRAFT_316 [Neurospora crassa]|uniref:Uncharacterized protein n=1 Tax=Neurospora crassa (strain ATCC 24698 / 74-OR23-1A / CBS 708.71 / DSM 1257 / FGSC 987) TaxID=367110 RepID=V5INV1_NEUCR|nr:hypothetical protein NCU16332 [Neurospora crassa OR74A]ESA43813.1 hypothetical protein NCU16332 [Neurospora crassa OR74A]KHE80256.1 hypothetical protein GE21DRAFT_316 [Neurospora crassa]|eukprot:XP_011393341.1 hypothetical protein NCU16332 [Neurospora crassa OR74A]